MKGPANMRVLVTGGAGFVAAHLMAALRRNLGPNVELIATGKEPSGTMQALDVTDSGAVQAAISGVRPTHIIHLAGIAAPAIAAAAPEQAWRVHVDGTLNLARAVLENVPDCCLVNAGTGLVYGATAKAGLPLDEQTLLAPLDDYAVSKAAADLALGAMAHKGLKCIRFRPFNHIGPGQDESFVAASFAMQIARIEAGLCDPVIRVGNLAAERDFLDVRDVAEAYARAVLISDEIVSGTVLNLASGTPCKIGDLLDMLLSLSRTTIRIEQDPARMRPSDLPRVVGDAHRARDLLAWAPAYGLEQTLADILADCRERLPRH